MISEKIFNIGVKLLFVVVKRGKGDRITEFLNSITEIPFVEIFMGKGTAPNAFLDILGLSDSEKDIVITLIRADEAKDILEKISEKFKLSYAGKGLAFTLSVSSIGGIELLQCLLQNKKENVNE